MFQRLARNLDTVPRADSVQSRLRPLPFLLLFFVSCLYTVFLLVLSRISSYDTWKMYCISHFPVGYDSLGNCQHVKAPIIAFLLRIPQSSPHPPTSPLIINVIHGGSSENPPYVIDTDNKPLPKFAGLISRALSTSRACTCQHTFRSRRAVTIRASMTLIIRQLEASRRVPR